MKCNAFVNVGKRSLYVQIALDKAFVNSGEQTQGAYWGGGMCLVAAVVFSQPFFNLWYLPPRVHGHINFGNVKKMCPLL